MLIIRLDFVAETLGVHPLSFPHLAALVTLRNRTTLALDLEQGSVGVVARGSSVTFDTRFAFVFLRQWLVVGGRMRRSTMQTSCR